MTAPVAQETFREACARFATGVAIATACDTQGNPHGLTVNSFTSVSLVPPIVLICIDARCLLLTHFRIAGYFAINVLHAAQRDLSVAFAVRPEQRFDGVPWKRGATGAPLLEGAIAAIECQITNIIETGDHAVIFGELVNATFAPGPPLVYFHRGYRELR